MKAAFFLRGERYMHDTPPIEGVLSGAARQASEPLDERITEALRNFLLGPGQMRPATGQERGYGLDLAALNLQRGRGQEAGHLVRRVQQRSVDQILQRARLHRAQLLHARRKE